MKKPNHAEGCACCHPVSIDDAVARFRALGRPGSHTITGMPVLHDALGLPVDVGDELWWPILGTGTQRIEWRSGQVMERATDSLHVFCRETERKQWVKPERAIAVTRLLKGGER
jgi:hypothetical protein